jgi:malate dehydrogenase (oxaloacetate-decarboxylating)(NADP+)
VFHDDQHGTAIISAAGLMNACKITKRRIEDVKVVLNGPGAAGIATLELIKAMGVRHENVIAVDRKGTLWRGRTEDMNQWKSAHVVDTPHRTLAEAIVGADCFIGLSAKGALTKEMVATMAKNPIIFAMANPDPEITPEEVLEVRKDAIIGHRPVGLSEPGQQRAGLPLHLPRRARRPRPAREPRDEDRLRRGAGPAGAGGRARRGGRGLSRPAAEVRARVHHPDAVRSAADLLRAAVRGAGGHGHRVARRPIEDMDAYKEALAQRLDPTAAFLQKITGSVQARPNKRSCSPRARIRR